MEPPQTSFLTRRLTALGYPKASSFSAANANDVRAVVSWVEETKLQNWKAEQRVTLQSQAVPEAEWKGEFVKYLQSLGCRRQTDDTSLLLEWLLSHTLAIERAADEEAAPRSLPPCDYNGPELKAAVEKLAAALHYPVTQDHKLMLSVILQHLQRKFVSPPAEGAIAFTLKDANLPIGFDTGDEYINSAATVLRMLFIQDLRDLRNRINEVIMMAQNITANPRTDLNLGKVGK